MAKINIDDNIYFDCSNDSVENKTIINKIINSDEDCDGNLHYFKKYVISQRCFVDGEFLGFVKKGSAANKGVLYLTKDFYKSEYKETNYFYQ